MFVEIFLFAYQKGFILAYSNRTNDDTKKKNGNSAFRRNLKLEPFFYLRIVHTLYMLIQYELHCFVEFLRYSEYSVNCISTNARNQPKENQRRASNVHVWGGVFSVAVLIFFSANFIQMFLCYSVILWLVLCILFNDSCVYRLQIRVQQTLLCVNVLTV